MCDGIADRDEQLQPLADRQLVVIGKARDRSPRHIFHDEVGPAKVIGAGIKHLGDTGMIHPRQRLALGLKARDDFSRIESEFHEFDGHDAVDGRPLLGLVDHAHAPLSERFENAVRPDISRHGAAVALLGLSGFGGSGLWTAAHVPNGVIQPLQRLPRSREMGKLLEVTPKAQRFAILPAVLQIEEDEFLKQHVACALRRLVEEITDPRWRRPLPGCFELIGGSINVTSHGIAGRIRHAVKVHPAKITFHNVVLLNHGTLVAELPDRQAVLMFCR